MKQPGFFTHLLLLWRLRLTIAFNRGTKSQWWLSIIAFLFSSAPAVGLALGFFGLVRLSAQLELQIWPDFLLRLLSFVTTCVWVTWPVLSQ